MRSNYKVLGNYIQEVNHKNSKLAVDKLLGVSITKKFIPSIANTIGTDMSTYKIVRTNQFAYGPVTSRNGERVSIALLEEDDCIVSSSYTVFEIMNTNELLPEYLMMWFRRPEFDRYARYMSHGSVREIFGWEELSDVMLPVPHVDEQREIVKEYNIIINRLKLTKQLNLKLEKAAQTIYKQWFEDFEFPNESGRPYKASGGEMVYSEDLEREIPKDWSLGLLKDLCTIKGGKRLPKGKSLTHTKNEHPYIKVADMGINKFVVLNDKFEYLSKIVQQGIARYTVSAGDIIISIVGTIGVVRIVDNTLDNANLTENCVKLTNLNKITADYLYHFFYSETGRTEMEMRVVGGVQGKLPIYNIESFKILCPTNYVIQQFTEKIKALNNIQQNNMLQNVALKQLKSILLSKVAIVQDVSLKEVQA